MFVVSHDKLRIGLGSSGGEIMMIQYSGWSWYTPDRDLMLLRGLTANILPYDVVEEVLLEPTKHFYDMDMSDEDMMDTLQIFPFACPVTLPKLKTISILMRKPTLVDRNCHPHAVSELFQGDSVVIFDVARSRQKSALFWRLLDILHKHQGRCAMRAESSPFLELEGDLLENDAVVSFQSAIRRIREDGSGLLQPKWPRLRRRLLVKFIYEKYQWTPLTVDFDHLFNLDLSPNLDIPWVKDMVGSIEIRPVHVLALLDGEPNCGPYRWPSWDQFGQPQD